MPSLYCWRPRRARISRESLGETILPASINRQAHHIAGRGDAEAEAGTGKQAFWAPLADLSCCHRPDFAQRLGS
jgi:hypothetical protein